MSGPNALSRRSLFGLAAGGVLSGQMQVSLEPALATRRSLDMGATDLVSRPQGYAIEVAGPRDSALAGWGRQLQAPLAAGLGRGRVAIRYSGGVDGVTTANQFDARVVPDGETALLFCGNLGLAWLAGDRGRVRLNPSDLLPIFAAYGPALLMVRGPLPAPMAGGLTGAPPAGKGSAVRAAPLRLALGPGPDAGLTALLGLDLLGIPAIPVPIRTDVMAAARSGTVDAVFVHGPEAQAGTAALVSAGFRPALSGWQHGVDAVANNAAVHALPGSTAPFFLGGLPPARVLKDPLVAAWRAMAAASTLCAVLAVPRLTPAAATGRWQRAAAGSVDEEGVSARAGREALLLVTASGAATALASMQVDMPAQLGLRRWMAERGAWRRG